jgi:hypothetical protein
MSEPSPLTQSATDQLRTLIDGPAHAANLNAALRLLGKWRAKLIENTLIQRMGPIVPAGPFAGMVFDIRGATGARLPRLLGCFEASLSPIIEEIIATSPRLIIDVGCAEGYYAVGLAMRLPQTTIWARDADAAACESCDALAEANNVASRVKTGGRLTHADFDICRAQPTTIICDIDGAEDTLLDPERAKGLRRADILVEVQETEFPGLCDRMTARFLPTHDIVRLERAFSSQSLPDWMDTLSDLDRLLALWEWRSGPTPWLWMKAKHR